MLLAKREIGTGLGHVWEVSGEEGALEVSDEDAIVLLRIGPHAGFYEVQRPQESEVVKGDAGVSDVAPPAGDIELPVNSPADFEEAVQVASPTRRRSAAKKDA